MLNHDLPSSLIRRPSGLTDSEWDWLANTSVRATSPEFPFMRALVDTLLSRAGHKVYLAILGSLGITPGTNLDTHNWEHSSFRFFRHFCPEDLRNAISHTGLRFARLEFDGRRFYWIAELSQRVCLDNEIFSVVNATIGDTVMVRIAGLNDIETVSISNGDIHFTYYEKGVSRGFGDMMYLLRKSIIENRIEEKKYEIRPKN